MADDRHPDVDGIDAVVWEADPATLACTFVNLRGTLILGHDLQEWQRAGFLGDLVHPSDCPRFESALRLAGCGKPSRALCRLRRGDGGWTRFLIALERVAPQGSDARVRGVMIDLAEVGGGGVPLHLAESTLELTETSASLGRVAGSVAHDFNNVLAAIVGYARLLERRNGNPAAVLQLAANIRAAGERGAAIARQLHQIGRSVKV